MDDNQSAAEEYPGSIGAGEAFEAIPVIPSTDWTATATTTETADTDGGSQGNGSENSLAPTAFDCLARMLQRADDALVGYGRGSEEMRDPFNYECLDSGEEEEGGGVLMKEGSSSRDKTAFRGKDGDVGDGGPRERERWIKLLLLTLLGVWVLGYMAFFSGFFLKRGPLETYSVSYSILYVDDNGNAQDGENAEATFSHAISYKDGQVDNIEEQDSDEGDDHVNTDRTVYVNKRGDGGQLPVFDSPVDLTEITFDDFLTREENNFVDFYAPWCSHCQRLAPTWDKFSHEAKSRRLPVGVGIVDCVKQGDLCKREYIYAFPTMRWYPGGEAMLGQDYKGERTVSALIEYTEKNLALPH